MPRFALQQAASLLASLALAWSVSVACGAERPALKDLGRSVKMRILVDKVMQPVAKWKTEEWMIKETAEAGFNVFSPRHGHTDMAAVRQVTEWCRKHGLYHMPWMRGATGTPEDAALSVGRRMLWANGSEQAVWSPNSDELWDWMARHIVAYAEISARDATLVGVFLDYENYWAGGAGNFYGLSDDDGIMDKFARSRKLAVPKLEPAGRKAWLEVKELHDEFEQFQIGHWRRKCRELREAVDRHNPRFMFNIYPAPGTKFMFDACYPEWATDRAPLVLADPWTYGRPGRYMTHAKGLEGNRDVLKRGMATAAGKGVNRIYIGGIDPVVTGADAEFCGKNALLLSGLGDGYWVFYEGPVYAKDHPAYFKWFSWANRHIATETFQAAWEPRETEDAYGFPKIRVSGRLPDRTSRREYPVVKLRGSNALIVSARKDTPAQLAVETFRIGRNEASLTWTLKDPDWEDLHKGELTVPQTTPISFTVPHDGLYILLLEAGRNACAVRTANAPLGILGNPHARLIYGAERLYFRLPRDVRELTFGLRGGGGVENVKLTVYGAGGKEVGSGQTTAQKNKLPVRVTAEGQQGELWHLTVGPPDAGVLEDVFLTLDKRLPPVLSYFEDEVFEAARE